MTDRKFYKTIIPLEIISEEPIGEREIANIIDEATTDYECPSNYRHNTFHW